VRGLELQRVLLRLALENSVNASVMVIERLAMVVAPAQRQRELPLRVLPRHASAPVFHAPPPRIPDTADACRRTVHEL